MKLIAFCIGLILILTVGIVLGRSTRDLLVTDPTRGAVSGGAAESPALPADVPPRATAEVSRGESVVEVTEAELERELNDRVAGRPIGSTPLGEATTESFAVSLRRGQIEIGGWSKIGLVRAPFAVVGTVTPSAGGRPSVKVTEARIGDVPMPESARGQIESGLQGELDAQLERNPVQVRSVEIGGGRMRIIGAPRA